MCKGEWRPAILVFIYYPCFLGKSQKKVLLMAGPLRGGGGKGRPGQDIFLYLFFQRSNILTAIKLEGG